MSVTSTQAAAINSHMYLHCYAFQSPLSSANISTHPDSLGFTQAFIPERPNPHWSSFSLSFPSFYWTWKRWPQEATEFHCILATQFLNIIDTIPATKINFLLCPLTEWHIEFKRPMEVPSCKSWM